MELDFELETFPIKERIRIRFIDNLFKFLVNKVCESDRLRYGQKAAGQQEGSFTYYYHSLTGSHSRNMVFLMTSFSPCGRSL